ncbi:MAG: long-chain fatty acid--CoA ligase [Gammaproteobacteria bacterium]|nr:long-chain fatty acid--CoA ligase [Gammaproteobacteria bacterium]NIR97697.1 long-chain fatty acid--CoA ligase [Gammaproteobacteria bacterium]NIT62890.1 long-chain fatty acid--CoA ligase [Gammaproteobacteria bacterium]NIV19855.1 hypothetical protein [Gammaproteobacteria bacterium]NIX11368.1 hypothetical protein [Gammaproteobacteria bacterium]
MAHGRLGHLDAAGHLYLTGRKRNLFITAFGRNVAPEWVEAELAAQPAIAQAAVFGEGRAFNTAVLVPRSGPGEAHEALAMAVAAANRALPAYARIDRWLVTDVPFTAANGQATANGRLRREAIYDRYRERIGAFYAAAEAAR